MPPPPLLREKNQTVRVLSVDGGGIRGIIPGFVLSFLERVTKTPLLDLFDVFVGTSTGGILAGGATHKHSNKPSKLLFVLALTNVSYVFCRRTH